MTTFDDLAGIGPQPVWDGVSARAVNGERMTMAVVELDPDAHVPEHRHENEQLGLVLHGRIRMRIDGDERDLAPGATYRILSNVSHEAWAGPHGAVVMDAFAPIRADWDAFEPREPSAPRWP
jgi:quercetin dioxygenase-like cupin family protein